jgi:uncharacterized protein involved in type VI secretion and phage assembly
MIHDFRPDGDGSRFFGVHPAIVTDVVDPKHQGRIEVRFPSLGSDGNRDVRAWATLVTPYADADQGFEFLPSVGVRVVVAFEAGDPRRPCILGSAWHGKAALPEAAQSANNKRLIKTRAGSLLEFDDTDGAPKITLSTNGGHTVVLDDAAQEITVRHSGGSVITLNAAGQVSIVANATVELTASALNVHAASAVFDGTITCTTMTASTSVVSPSYTPGAGNVW